MEQIWLRKRHTWHVGSVDVTVSMVPEVAERVRASAVYQRFVKPLRGRREPVVPVKAITVIRPIDEEGAGLLERVNAMEWYQTIDLGHGVVTPGTVDHRTQVSFYGLSSSMEGMRVLDVGTYDGFWAFEFERRGAEVVALDVATWVDGEVPQRMKPHAAEFGLDVPTGTAFALAAEALGSKVKRVEAPIHDVTPEMLGQFDLVFVSDVLVHLRCPQLALERLASVCAGEMIVADVFTPMLEGFGELPFAQYAAPSHHWWIPNVKTLWSWMNVAGMDAIEEVSRFELQTSLAEPIHKVVLRGTMNTLPPWLVAYRDWALTTSPKWKSAEEQPV